MKEKTTENGFTFYDLKWDTEFFDVTCAKAILHKALTINEWIELKTKFKNYQFISIENRHSEPLNAQMIGMDTSAFLADVNIQFVKKLEFCNEMPKNITIHRSFEKNEQIIALADFQFSKFTEDPRLANRGGNKVYCQWLLNSFSKPNKYFAVSKDNKGDINGFLLHSYSDNSCVIELIAVSKTVAQSGIGTRLFKAVEYSAYQKSYSFMRVGTQLRNIGAINFYHKVGCKQLECNQVYHLWNLQ